MQEVQINAARVAAPPPGGPGGDDCCDLSRLINLVQDAMQYAWDSLVEFFTALYAYFFPEETVDHSFGAPHLLPIITTNPFSEKCRAAVENWLKEDPFGSLEYPYEVKTICKIYPHFANSEAQMIEFSQTFNESNASFPEYMRNLMPILAAKFEREKTRFDLTTVKVGVLACATKTQDNGREYFMLRSKIFADDRINDEIARDSLDPETNRTTLLSQEEIRTMCAKEIEFMDKRGQPPSSDAMQLGDIPVADIPDL